MIRSQIPILVVMLACKCEWPMPKKPLTNGSQGKTAPSISFICCYKDPVPSGWLTAARSFHSSGCPEETSCTIVRYDDLVSGSIITVCNDIENPSGWATVSEDKNSSACNYAGTTGNIGTRMIKKF